MGFARGFAFLDQMAATIPSDHCYHRICGSENILCKAFWAFLGYDFYCYYQNGDDHDENHAI